MTEFCIDIDIQRATSLSRESAYMWPESMKACSWSTSDMGGFWR